ncbi:hypothetical protein CAC42_4421 [Sphaceloma murrayae]|uniref:Protein RTM1 n=1 Tax=Sphaceloma murrayae TaxID=2082308 RepID=A0A2K1QMC6_9PEZI|nr:hypothetical protein CAC42_4421 [Sphaceloma murrayae]
MTREGEVVPGSWFIYAPNKGAPIFFAVAFAICGFWHLWQCIHFKCFRITSLLPLSALGLAAGFAAREVGAFQLDNLQVYIATVMLLYIPPPVIELANYHIFGRVLYYVPYCSPVHPGRTLTTLGAISAVVEILNGIGISWTANSTIRPAFLNAGKALLRASLLVQVAVIAMFYVMIAIFFYRCQRARLHHRGVRHVVLGMIVSSTFILVRCLFRTVEIFSETDGTGFPAVYRYEWLFYVLEAVPLLISIGWWNFFHPRHYLPEDYHIYLAQDGVTERIGGGWIDDRPFIWTVLDPFGICMGKPTTKPFWEVEMDEPNNRQRR